MFEIIRQLKDLLTRHKGSWVRRDRTKRLSRQKSARPKLEYLEERCLLSFNEFPLPMPDSQPAGITRGPTPDGNLWFVELTYNDIRCTTPDGTLIGQFTIPTDDSIPGGLVGAPDGNLWFTESRANQIGRVTTDGTFTEFPLPSPDCHPGAITVGPDHNLWFTEFAADQIGRITPDGSITEFAIAPGSQPESIVAGPDNNIWFTEQAQHAIGRMNPDGTNYTEFFPGDTPGVGITVGPDGNLWFSKYNANKIAKMAPDGTLLQDFSVPTSNSGPGAITVGPDQNLWFVEFLANKITKLTPDGVFTEHTVPTADSTPSSIVTGPDGNIWFTEYAGNKIGQFIDDGGRAAPFGPFNQPRRTETQFASLDAIERAATLPAGTTLEAAGGVSIQGGPVSGTRTIADNVVTATEVDVGDATADVDVMFGAFGKHAGEDGYAAYLDYYGDGVIDDAALYAFIARYGTTLEP